MYGVCAVAVLLGILFQTSYANYSGALVGRPPMCTSPSKPCRLRVNMTTFDGEEVASNGVQTCTCSTPHQCSDDWTSPGQVVSRNVVSTTFNITLEMMFCRPVEPLAFCRRRSDEIALELKGSMNIPLDITAYNCRCRRRRPLMLTQRWFGDDYQVHHAYKCANHVRYCRPWAACFTSDDVRVTYNCRCRPGLQCREVDGTSGYCMP